MTKKQLIEWLDRHNIPDDAHVFVELDMGILESVNPDYRQLTAEDIASNPEIWRAGDEPGEFILVL